MAGWNDFLARRVAPGFGPGLSPGMGRFADYFSSAAPPRDDRAPPPGISFMDALKAYGKDTFPTTVDSVGATLGRMREHDARGENARSLGAGAAGALVYGPASFLNDLPGAMGFGRVLDTAAGISEFARGAIGRGSGAPVVDPVAAPVAPPAVSPTPESPYMGSSVAPGMQAASEDAAAAYPRTLAEAIRGMPYKPGTTNRQMMLYSQMMQNLGYPKEATPPSAKDTAGYEYLNLINQQQAAWNAQNAVTPFTEEEVNAQRELRRKQIAAVLGVDLMALDLSAPEKKE